MVAKTINKFYFFNVGTDSNLKQEIISIIDKANEPQKVDKHPRRDLYEKILKDFYAGKYGDGSLREICFKEGLPYDQIIKFHRKTE